MANYYLHTVKTFAVLLMLILFKQHVVVATGQAEVAEDTFENCCARVSARSCPVDQTKQVVWPPGATDTVCPRPRAITQFQRLLLLFLWHDSECSNRLYQV